MHTEDAEGINLTHLSPPVRSWVYIGGLGKVMSKESAPPMLTCLSIHQQLWINRWIMGIVLWRLIHLIILHMLFLSLVLPRYLPRYLPPPSKEEDDGVTVRGNPVHGYVNFLIGFHEQGYLQG